MSEELNPNIFMICKVPNRKAFREVPRGYSIRLCQKNELEIWKRMPFDTEEMADQYMHFMDEFFEQVYAPKGDLFFERCFFVVDVNDKPVGTGFSWKAYDTVTTMGWFKVIKECEGKGIGRAILTKVMNELSFNDYPVLLHTQPSSNKAIKLYSDFGFEILTDNKIGQRTNHINDCLAELQNSMPQEDFEGLKFTTAPKDLLDFLSIQTLEEF